MIVNMTEEQVIIEYFNINFEVVLQLPILTSPKINK